MTLSVKNLCFSYSSVSVLKDVSLEARAGECTVLIGVNGAGKTTLLKCMDRILKPTGGVIRADDRDIWEMSLCQLAKTVAYVPQTTTFAGGCTVFDAVLIGRRPYFGLAGASDADVHIAGECLNKLGLSSLAMREVGELSGGEKQMVAIARALAQQPKILLFDEPTGNLDLKNQIIVAERIRGIVREEKMAAVVTMHDLNLALRFADRFVLMKDNTIFASGGGEILTSENLKEVYGIRVLVTSVDGRTAVIPEGGNI